MTDNASPSPAPLTLRPAALAPWLAAAWLGLMACTVLAYLAGGGARPYLALSNWFDLTARRSLHDVASAVVLLGVFGLTALAAWRAGAGRRGLAVAAALLLALAVEQLVVIHWPLENRLAPLVGGWARLASQLPLLLAVAGALVAAWPALPAALRRPVAVCAAGYAAGAVGVFGLSGLLGGPSLATTVVLIAARALGLAALSALLLALLRHAARAGAAITVRVPPWLPGRWLTLHALTLVVLAGLSLLARALAPRLGLPHALVERFNVDSEQSFFTALSGFALVVLALLLAGVAGLKRAARDPWRGLWVLLAAAFGYLALDEMGVIHEHIGAFLGDLRIAGLATHRWVWPVLPMVAVFGLLYLRFLWRLPRRTAALMVAAGTLYVGGALGLEIVGAAVASTAGGASLAYLITLTVEELLEGLGIAVMLYAVLDYAGASWEAVRVALVPARARPPAVAAPAAAARQQ